jgi:hypothetical protein
VGRVGTGHRGYDQHRAFRPSWADRYIALSTVLLGIGLVSVWTVSSYLRLTPSELASFVLPDGWCNVGQESIGVHCFGDFAIVNELFAGDPWNSGFGSVASYPALAWIPSLVIFRLGAMTGSARASLLVFLAISAVALFTPAVWAGWRSWTTKAPISLALVGGATAPFLITLDRANTMALVVPFLLLFAVSYARKNVLLMCVAIAGAALLKPQMALLAILLLSQRKYRALILTGGSTAVLTVLGFAVFPSHFPANFRGWLSAISGYSGSQSVDTVYPYNLGIGRSLLTVVDITGIGADIGLERRATVVTWLGESGNLLSGVAICAGAIVLVLLGRKITALWSVVLAFLIVLYSSSTVYLYYTSMFLVVAALVIRDPAPIARPDALDGNWSGGLDAESADAPAARHSRGEMMVSGLVVVVTGLVLAPVIIPAKLVSAGLLARHNLAGLTSFSQLLVGPLLLLLFVSMLGYGCIRIVRDRRGGLPVESAAVDAPAEVVDAPLSAEDRRSLLG